MITNHDAIKSYNTGQLSSVRPTFIGDHYWDLETLDAALLHCSKVSLFTLNLEQYDRPSHCSGLHGAGLVRSIQVPLFFHYPFPSTVPSLY